MSRTVTNTCFFLFALIFAGGGCREPEKPARKILKFHLAHRIETRAPAGLTSIANFYQPPRTEYLYILDNSSSMLFELSAISGQCRKIIRIPKHLCACETFTVDPASRKAYLFVNDSMSALSLDYGNVLSARPIEQMGQRGFLVTLSRNFRPALRGGRLYMHYFPNIEQTFKSPAFFRCPVEAAWDLRTGSIKLLPAYYPHEYQQRCFGFNFAPDRFFSSDGSHCYSFPYNDSLYTLNQKTNLREVRFFGSLRKRHIRSIPYSKIASLNSSVFTALYTKTDFYGLSGYAGLAKCYYRYLLVTDRKTALRKRILILFDSGLNYLGESEDMFEHGILVDSRAGLRSLSFDRDARKLTLANIAWK